jgi:hypothetical protein
MAPSPHRRTTAEVLAAQHASSTTTHSRRLPEMSTVHLVTEHDLAI